eukprot:GFUD01038968.1.p1 GENE.GFUD01038968.1~~GFUD01038968.1.p1  ORF type:complete len:249 (-),score=41.19 GFUD01038968.1:131-877(-)
MEGVCDEVVYFGLASVIGGVVLYRTVFCFTSSIRDPTENMMSDTGPTRSSNYDCAICLGEAEFAVETNCGHVYCGNCLLEVWRRSSSLTPSPCPYCRQSITIILPYFSDGEKNSAEPADGETCSKILTDVYTYNRRYSGDPRSIVEQVRDLPMLLRHLVIYLFSGDGLHLAFQLRVGVLAVVWVVYLLSPLDLLPEAVFGLIGLLDDLVIFLLISMYLTFFFRQIMSNVGGGAADVDVPGDGPVWIGQ